MVREKIVRTTRGDRMLLLGTLLLAGGAVTGVGGATADRPVLQVLGAVGIIAAAVTLRGLYRVLPNEARVLQCFGDYKGSVRTPGLRWSHPICTRKRVFLGIRTFESGRHRVRNRDGQPVAVTVRVIWRVRDTAKAVFAVDDLRRFVETRSIHATGAAAVNTAMCRNVVPVPAECESANAIHRWRAELQTRVAEAGVEVIDACMTYPVGT